MAADGGATAVESRRSGVARFARFARLHPHNAGLDQHVVRTANQQQMFDIVAPHQQQLALAIEVEGLDEAETQLPRPRPARNAPAQIDGDLDDLEDEHEGDKKGDARQNPRQHSVVL